MKFTADFDAFLREEVNLNQTRLDRLQERVDAVSDFVAEHATFEDAFIDTIPAGSWAHGTIIRPVKANDGFDGDVLLYLEEQAGWLPKDYIEQLYQAFRGSSTYREMVSRKKRCLRINYAGDFHIDLVPYLEYGGKHVITNRLEPEDEGRYEASDPEAVSAWIDERQRITNRNFVKAVRLAKYLRDHKDKWSCKSIILTTLLGNLVNEVEASYDDTLYADVPSAFVTLLGKLAYWLPDSMPAVMDPADTGDNFTDRYRDDWNYDNFREWISYYADKAERAFKETDRDKSLDLWRELFGDEFKPGALVKAAAAPLSASVPWAREQFIDQSPFTFPVRPAPAARVRISARCTGLEVGRLRRRNGFRQFDLAMNGNRVAKNRSLRFRAAVTNVSGPYDLYWKVRNGGEEAAARQQLRGEITKDAGQGVKTESTSYKGTHYVECFVVQGGVVVARDRQMVIVGR